MLKALKKNIVLWLAASALSPVAAAQAQWILAQSTLTYHVSHPLHQVDGVSHAARGKGACHDGQCDFLIAAPVKSFDSGDSNRDLHMLQVARGGQYPMVTVRTRLKEVAQSGTIRTDLDVEFAGQTAHYKDVPFKVTGQGSEVKISGEIPSKLTDF